jgi:2-hydroxy-3-keto-5-methylthiopentenyl-1-phosphate phosphatase
MLRRPKLHGDAGRETLAHGLEKTQHVIGFARIVFQPRSNRTGREAAPGMKLAVLSDFDGTVTLNDTFENVLAKFAEGDWRAVDELYVKGEVTLEECLRRQGAMVKIPKSKILEELDQVTEFRPNFDKLIEYCETNHYPLVLVSAGLDFVIKHFLGKMNWKGQVELSAAKSRCTPTGIKFDWPPLKSNKSVSLKDDMVRYYKQKADTVVYIGDGKWDLHALRNADRRFVIKNSKLAELCREQDIQVTVITDCQNVLTSIQKEM